MEAAWRIATAEHERLPGLVLWPQVAGGKIVSRTVAEWTGRTDDTKAPPRVRQRIFDAAGGVCHICKLAIKPGETWQADHVKALINGGANAESNLAPAHGHCHVGKSALDLKEKAKVAKVRGKHIGAIRPKQTIKSAPFPKTEKPAPKLLPARRGLYARTSP